MTNGHRGLASPAFFHGAVEAAKRALRDEARTRRAAAHARSGDGAALAVRDAFLDQVPVPAGAVVAGYSPIRDELDVMPLMERLAAAHICALPVVTAPATPLVFRRWRPGDALERGQFGVASPGASASELRPDVLLVPMLAFDRFGRRMGYGAGFYDRTLARLRSQGTVLAVGIAFAEQEVPSVPVDGHDQALDWIVTERGAFRPAGSLENSG